MKKILSVLAAGIAAVACAVSITACARRVGVMDKKTHNELRIDCPYKNQDIRFALPITYKWRHYSGSYAKIKSTSDKDTLYGQLKGESSFVEEHCDSLLLLMGAENYEYPQYVALSYKGVNGDDSKYYDYEAMHQSAEYWGEEEAVYFSFPLAYVTGLEGAFLAFGDKGYSVNVDCTFEQLKTFYTRLDYAYVSAAEDSVNVKGYMKKLAASHKIVYEDVELLLKYANGTVTASVTE